MAPDFFEDPDDTRGEIMQATYRALCEHGYADLTIQRIGDHFAKSKSLLYHHYDGKDDLLVDFLAFMLEQFEADVSREKDDDPVEHLLAIVDHVLQADYGDERAEFSASMVELRAQAAHHPAYREQFSRTDQFFHDRLTDVIQQGINQGMFREADPERVAWLLLATFDGARNGRATSDSFDVAAVRAELETYVTETLLVENHP